MSATNDPNSVDCWRRACRRWQMIALFSLATLAVVSVSLGTLLYGESAAKCEAWELARAARKALQADEAARRLQRLRLLMPQGREFRDLDGVQVGGVEPWFQLVELQEQEPARDLHLLLQVSLAPDSARPFLQLLLWKELKSRQP